MRARSPQYASASGPPPSRAAKRVALLGVGSLPGLLFCGLGAALAVAALVLAPGVRREIEASGTQGGAEIVRIAQICAIATLAITVVVVVLAIVITGLFVLN